MEQQIKIAAKLYRCRDSMKGLFGVEYQEKMKWYIQALNDHAKKQNIDVLKAVLEICDMPSIKSSGVTTVLFLAAAVEILEPST